jgi:prolyl-tRNA synthetase
MRGIAAEEEMRGILRKRLEKKKGLKSLAASALVRSLFWTRKGHVKRYANNFADIPLKGCTDSKLTVTEAALYS